jgi:hypothetical protein
VNDHEKFAFLVQGIASIVESIFHCAAVEALYPLTGSAAAAELERALVHLYAAIMLYLSKAKSYFKQSSASLFIRLLLRRLADVSEQIAPLKVGFLARGISMNTSKPSIKHK